MSTSRTDQLGHGIEVVMHKSQDRIEYRVDHTPVAYIQLKTGAAPYITTPPLHLLSREELIRIAAAYLFAADRMSQLEVSDIKSRSLIDGR